MKDEVKKLLELRKEYPITGYLAIAAILISVVLGLIAATNGSFVPLIVGVILFVFLAFLLVVFSRVLADERRGFYFWLTVLLLSFVALVFMAWVVLLTLAALCLVTIGFFSLECSPIETNVTGSLQPSYTMQTATSHSDALDHYRSSCEGSSADTFRACLPEGYIATSASVLNQWLKNDNGHIGATYADPNNNRCFQVDWRAGSGGRTGIGECRYHGHIKLDLEVVGYRDERIDGARENFEGILRNANAFRYSYSQPIPSGATDIYWEYSAEVSFPGSLVETAWTAHLSDEIPQDGCVDSEISASAIRLRANC